MDLTLVFIWNVCDVQQIMNNFKIWYSDKFIYCLIRRIKLELLNDIYNRKMYLLEKCIPARGKNWNKISDLISVNFDPKISYFGTTFSISNPKIMDFDFFCFFFYQNWNKYEILIFDPTVICENNFENFKLFSKVTLKVFILLCILHFRWIKN